AWTTAVDFMAKFVTSELETPYLLVISSSNYEHYFLYEEKKGWSIERILTYLEVCPKEVAGFVQFTYFVSSHLMCPENQALIFMYEYLLPVFIDMS
ncbi:unnamed protein product, partial [Allacma fusca]